MCRAESTLRRAAVAAAKQHKATLSSTRCPSTRCVSLGSELCCQIVRLQRRRVRAWFFLQAILDPEGQTINTGLMGHTGKIARPHKKPGADNAWGSSGKCRLRAWTLGYVGSWTGFFLQQRGEVSINVSLRPFDDSIPKQSSPLLLMALRGPYSLRSLHVIRELHPQPEFQLRVSVLSRCQLASSPLGLYLVNVCSSCCSNSSTLGLRLKHNPANTGPERWALRLEWRPCLWCTLGLGLVVPLPFRRRVLAQIMPHN